jgi:hypothetical protein
MRSSRLKRRWLPWALIGCVLVVWLAVLVLLLPVVRDVVGMTEPSRTTVRIADDRLRIEVELPDGFAITDIAPRSEVDSCPTQVYRLAAADHDLGRLELELVPADCELPGKDKQRILNGRHGVYRSIDDVPEPLDVARLGTELGPATVFTQKYVECTNGCNTFFEPVAIVKLDHPVDPDYPVLVLRGDGEDLSRDDLNLVLASVSRPE